MLTRSQINHQALVNTETSKKTTTNGSANKITSKQTNSKAQSESTTHPPCWNQHAHYGQCGQSCPCCRSRCGEKIGACPICNMQLSIFDRMNEPP